MVLDGEPRGERPSRAGPAAAAAGHPARAGAGPAAGVAVGPAVAQALDPAGAAARGAARARVPPGRRREPVPQRPVRHRQARQHAQPRRRDHHRRHHPPRADLSFGSWIWDRMERKGREGEKEECFSLASFGIAAGDDSTSYSFIPACGEEKIWGPCVAAVVWPESAAILCRRRALRRRGEEGARVVL